MSLLGARLYDPATMANKSTAALAVMTALDTTNLRIAFTVPSNGSVLVRMQGTINGGSATPWFPSILFGVMSGSTVVARHAPAGLPQGSTLAASTFLTVESLFVVPGLTPGAALTWDAAYGVEVSVTGSAIKYGGPNNASGATPDGFGAFLYEVWTTN